MANSLMIIYPYRWEGMWVFDDEAVGLVKEPFVEGVDTMIDKALEMKGILNGEGGFRLIFSESEFPRYDLKFDWVRKGEGGNWYSSEEYDMEGWLCPALFKYFDQPPKTIFARFEEKNN